MHAASVIDDLIRACADRLSADNVLSVEPIARSISPTRRNPLPWYQIAAICRSAGHLDLWHRATEIALAMPHDAFEHQYHRANAKLLLGDWSGWLDREVRIYDPAAGYLLTEYVRQIRYRMIEWDGEESIQDKTILILADGDSGDCIQMLRFIPLLAERCRRVILAVRPELVSFIKHNFGHLASITLLGVERDLRCQRYAWLMSLPAFFGGLPVFVPLTAPQPRPRADAVPHLLDVGLCWAGDPGFEHHHCRWHSLQLGPQGDQLRTFADAANVMMGLDCVVSVDTAVAHLAGTLGVPTFTLLHSAADARWGLHDTSPWYPSMRLIRQRVAGCWDDAIGVLRESIDALAADLVS